MTPAEVTKLLAVLKAQYQNMTVNSATEEAWKLAMEDVPYPAAMQAAQRWMKDEEWPPNSAQLRRLVWESRTELPAPDQAWLMVQDRIKNTYPGHQMPPWLVPVLIIDATEQVGGLRAIRTTEKPDDMRKRFIATYSELRKSAMHRGDIWLTNGERYGALGQGRDNDNSRT